MRSHTLAGRLFLALLLLAQLPAQAQQPNAQKEKDRADEQITHIDRYPVIAFNALVLSATTGEVVGDLTVNDFVVFENDVQQSIDFWWRPPLPSSLLVVVDTASGIANSKALDREVQGLKSSLAEWLGPEDEVSIIAMGPRPVLLQDYTSNKKVIGAALDKLSQNRSASSVPFEKRLNRGLQKAAEQARRVHNPQGRCAVILISDPPNNADDELVSQQSVRGMIEPGNTVFCWNRSAHFTPPRFNDGDYPYDDVSLVTLVGLSGGEFVNGNWKSLLERIRGRYFIAYAPIYWGRDGRVVKLRLELKPNAKRDVHDLVLVYPRFAVMPTAR